ncbi:MAG: SAM-dependent methyltransferase [Ktedonobacteraceae bacterium]
MKLALKITPQRSTQYANMVETLALPELLASPLGSAIKEVVSVTLAGQRYLLATLDDEKFRDRQQAPIQAMMPVLSRLGATSEVYEYFEQLSDVQGPLLRPLEPQFTPFVPLEMAEVRRYKGKTNEDFTQVLLNIALFAGSYAQRFSERLRILDPLAGRGTTLFLVLAAGYDAFGIETQRQDVETTAVFIRQYLHTEHIPYKELAERGRRVGRRYQFEIGQKKATRMLVLSHGDTSQANLHLQEVPGGPKMHAIVGDLPYGIQHFGEIAELLQKALPVWEQLLLPGGTLALAWNATRIERANMIALVEKYTHLKVKNEPPYTQLAHTVDRVIKKRDILVAVKS